VEEVRRFFLASGLFCFSSIAFSQVVCVGTVEQCRKSQKTICANEKAGANLDLAGAQRVQGVIKDPTGAPFSFSGGNFQVQLRNVSNGQVLHQTSLDSEGRFTLTNLHGKTFRLIVVRLIAGVAQRTGFDQPTNLRCENSEDCRVSIVLRVGPTDQPVDLCPPK
jgi:hypothetical protein